MGGHRGAAALARLGPGGLRELGIGFGLALVGAAMWHRVTVANRTAWEKANADYAVKKAAKRKQFEAWLAAQPFDDEKALV
jgi:hypothetical protein